MFSDAAGNDVIGFSHNNDKTNEEIVYDNTSSNLVHIYVKVYAKNGTDHWTHSCYNLQFVYSLPNSTTFCDGTTTLTTSSGAFDDGSGNADYHNNSDCKWLIHPNGATSITLHFFEFSTEAATDIVNIYNGNNSGATLLGSYSGNAIPPTLTSSGGSMFIEFITNNTITASGWSASYTSNIPVSGNSVITGYEYWFDNDYNSVNGVPTTALETLNLNINVSTSGLPFGLHSIHTRFHDNNGYYSSIISQFFYKRPIPIPGGAKIVTYEYWFDSDYNSKVYQAVSASDEHELITGIIANSLLQGLHSFHLRYKDNAGQWSSVISQFFYKRPIPVSGGSKIIAYEYWFDIDYGSKVLQSVTVSDEHQLMTGIIASSLFQGLHSFHLRYKDNGGQWSSVISQFFYKTRVTNGLPNLVSSYRYWFDMADSTMTNITLSTLVNPLELITDINTCGLAQGSHTVHFQFKDEFKYWSSVLTDTFYKPVLTIPVISPSSPTTVCLGDSIMLTASPGSNYLWSNGSATQSIYVSSAGTYWVSVDNGCGQMIQSNPKVVTLGQCATLGGIISYNNGANTLMTNVDVYVKQSNVIVGQTVTDDNGHYFFPNLTNGIYSISEASSKPWGGVNSADALLVAKHFVGLITLGGLKLSAADVNGTNSINSADALLIARRFVGLITSFSMGDWVFEKDTVLINGTSNVTKNFKSLCFGDVNGTYTPTAKTEPSISLNTNGIIAIDKETEIEIPITVSQGMAVGAISLIFEFPSSCMSIEDISSTYSGNLVYNVIGDELRISWYSTIPMDINEGETLLMVKCRLSSLDNSSCNLWSVGPESQIADGNAITISHVNLNIPKLIQKGGDFYLGQNVPNPFTKGCDISYYLPESGKVLLKVYDMLGSEIKTLVNITQPAGTYTTYFEVEDLPAGIYCYKIEVNGATRYFSKTKEMVIVD